MQRLKIRIIWFALSLLFFATASALAEKPTRAAIIAYNTQCKTSEKRANFIGKFGADFSNLDLSGVDFKGHYSVGANTNLLAADFTGANLRGAEFGNAVLDNASFANADLTDASFITASLKQVELRGTRLNGTKFYQSDLAGIEAEDADFSPADITGSSFAEANLKGALFSGAKSEYWWCDFHGADLKGAKLHAVKLSGANFSGANLVDADLSSCQLEQADFTGATLRGAKFDGANVKAAIFDSVIGLDSQTLNSLRKQAARWHFDATNGTKAFLDSWWFALCLVIAFPPIAIILRRICGSTRSSESVVESSRRFQFRISTLLLTTLLVALFLGVGMWSGTGLYSLTMVTAGYMMVGQIAYGTAECRRVATVLSITAFLYAAINLGVFVAVVMFDPFELLAIGFMVVAVLIGPIVMFIVGSISLFIVKNRMGDLRHNLLWATTSGAAALPLPTCG